MMEILLAIAAWFGLAGVIGAGWARFFRKVGPAPVPPLALALEAEAGRRVGAVVAAGAAALRRGERDAEVVPAMVLRLNEIADDLVACHGQAGADAFSATASAALNAFPEEVEEEHRIA